MRFLELCVDLHKGRTAKEGLMQFKNVAQNTSVSSIEVVVKKFIQLADAKVQEAQEKADQLAAVDDVDDLEATETPENVLLSAVSGDQNKDRTDRAVVAPWLKFLWESYRTVLEALQQRSFRGDLPANRCCSIQVLLEAYPQSRVPSLLQTHSINLADPDTLQRHPGTRFAQPNTSVELSLSQEAFRSAEDIHNLLTMSKKALPEVQPDDPIPGLNGTSAEAVTQHRLDCVLRSTRRCWTICSLKAHLQQYNNLTLPERAADPRARDLIRRDALEEMARSAAGEEEGKRREQMLNSPRQVSFSLTLSLSTYSLSDFILDASLSTQQHRNAIRAPSLDKTLVTVIDVPNAVRHGSSIVGWMRAGGMRPNSEEIAKVAALVEEEQRGQDVEEDVEEGTSGEVAENDGVRSLSKRASSPWIEGEQESPKRLRQDSGAMEVDVAPLIVGEPEIVTQEIQDPATASAVSPINEVISPQLTEQLQTAPTRTESPTITSTIDPTSIPASTPTTGINNDLPADPPTDTTPAPHSSDPTSAKDAANHRPTRRGRRRNRGKPFFPASHPLSANDSYPFFTDGNPDEKLWFQDREIYTYWVGRGLLALKECGIEPEAGVEGV
ncbi:eukaryotic translation initiation factor 3 subunit A [Ceratobasidium sp. 392]|nr:eukaryotic translation initiation factor 3 subunit A [Ceratobasidium sp. 392]